MKCFTFLALCWLALSSQAVNIPHSHDAQYDAQYDTANSASDVQQDGGLDEQDGSLDEQVQIVSPLAESLVQVSEEEDPEEGESGKIVSEEEVFEEGASGKRVSEEEEFEEKELEEKELEEKELEEEEFEEKELEEEKYEEEKYEEEELEEEKSEEGIYEELLEGLNEELAVAEKSREEAVEAQSKVMDEYKSIRPKWPFIVGAYSNSATRITTPKKDHSQQALHMKPFTIIRKKKTGSWNKIWKRLMTLCL
ncbi:hypothetical protein BSLG_006095 [Batrachochytrium salamandrivorans]|nr:hypothetical protein BSLG_006095 [Batrachochytrium salamandrivorans]